MKSVVVVAGTADARNIIKELVTEGIRIVATVATGFGRELLEWIPGVEAVEGRLDSEQMAELVRSNKAICLVDASHPFAVEVSVNAQEACKRCGLPYLRYERQATETVCDGVIRVKDFEAAAELAAEYEGNILLTVGSKQLYTFVKRICDYKSRLFARVLPESRILAECEKMGLSPKNIIAIKGPFSENMNIEIIKHCNAAVVVSKDSGDTGGTAEKISAAAKAGIPLILVDRPEAAYTNITGKIPEVVQFVRDIAASSKGDG
ncbi:MAG: precorrin-6A reductase [Clostridia bacterium]|nr:precorrin-6A reductase [Clostridia bacterium]